MCLFFWSFVPGISQEWTFDHKQMTAYDHVLNLRFEEAKKTIGRGESEKDMYVLSLAEVIELLITEDAEKFVGYEMNFQDRLESKKRSGAFNSFLQADMRLQWAFVYLKFGHEFDAALNIRNAFQIARACQKKYPSFLPVKKTGGLLNIMLGSVPEKYNWLLALLGLEGNIQQGLDDLGRLATSGNALSREARMLQILIQGLVLQDQEAGLEAAKKLRASEKKNPLLDFFAATLAIKNSQSEYALAILEQDPPLSIPYTGYLRGEIFLQKGNYAHAISAYQTFISEFKGQNYIKDTWFKIGLCYWLDGNPGQAGVYFERARRSGKESAEADRHAAKVLSSDVLPNVNLSKIRYFTDGGYYAEAHALMEQITPDDLRTRRDSVEFYYRKARLLQKQNRFTEAKLLYDKVIKDSENGSWYFAPNSCLQQGYMALSEGNEEQAEGYFRKALQFTNHEYKNSIDSKARSALSQMKRR